jgi:hypothetical protein
MNNIRHFIRNEGLLLFLIAVVLLDPFFYGSRISLIFILFLIARLKKMESYIDIGAIYLFLFTLSFEVLWAFSNDYNGSGLISIIPNILTPVGMYFIGKYVSLNNRGIQKSIFFLFYLTLFFSLVPIISILYQISVDGFTSGSRIMYSLWNKSEPVSATVFGSYFVFNMGSIGLINISRNTKLENRITIGIVILFALSLICVARLGTRTQLVIAFISILSTFLLNLRRMSLLRMLVIVLSMAFVTNYLMSNLTLDMDVLTFFADRSMDDGRNFNTAGGRADRWTSGLEAVFTDPLGWDFNRFGYAHNLWIDVARQGGVMPLAFLLMFTAYTFNGWLKVLNFLKKDLFIRSYLFLYFSSFMLMFSVEPIMEGMYELFMLFCLFAGYIRGLLFQGMRSKV